MLLFILRRLGQAVITILGVMIITFLLFRVISGDIARTNLGPKATEQACAQWRHRHGYDLPMLLNIHSQLRIEDKSYGSHPLHASSPKDSGSNAVDALAMILADAPAEEESGEETVPSAVPPPGKTPRVLVGRYVERLSAKTPLSRMIEAMPLTDKPSPKVPQPRPLVELGLVDGTKLTIDLSNAQTAGDLIHLVNEHPQNKGRLVADITPWQWQDLFHSQFCRHLYNSVTFDSRSLKDNRRLVDIIAQKGPYSLAITVPAMALEFVLGLMIACFVAYYRGRPVDKIGVLLSVLGMCVPFLAFMIYGQWLMSVVSPKHAYGTFYRVNIYLPICIMVLADLGSTVRFYRTILLDETNRDYVRTARAKGLPLTTILFKHVLKNCMLPILTNLILHIPFLIMGSLLIESYFGIPGLGDLMITSIFDRNEPILNGLVFLTALVTTLGVLLTDLSYALFDPRIRLG